MNQALALADQHGWTAIRHNLLHRVVVLFSRGNECMESEWCHGAMTWAEYWSPTEPECVHTEHYNVLAEFLSTHPVY